MSSFTFQIFEVIDPLGENLDFFSPLGFDVQKNSGHKTQKIKLYSVRALKRYLNEKNLTHGRVIATISKFSLQIFETYFRLCSHCTGQVFAPFQKLLRYSVNKNECCVTVQKLFRSFPSMNRSPIRHTICNALF